MTLVLTQFTDKGIVMAADTMATIGRRSYPNATKLYAIPELNAGVSVWGHSTTKESPDEWLSDFVHNKAGLFDSIDKFAQELETQAREDFEKQKSKPQITGEPRASLGFHVAGYDDDEEERFFNINNKSEGGDAALVELGNASREAQKKIKEHLMWIVRNGVWEDYAILFNHIAGFSQELNSAIDFRLPDPPTLTNYAKYLGFQILLVSAIHELSSLSENGSRPIIGGKIHVLMISPDGIVDGKRKTLAIDPEEPEKGIQLR